MRQIAKLNRFSMFEQRGLKYGCVVEDHFRNKKSQSGPHWNHARGCAVKIVAKSERVVSKMETSGLYMMS